MAKPRKKLPRSPSALTIDRLTLQGWSVDRCESRRGPFAFDLFGFADLVAHRGRDLAFVQVTSHANRASRRTKIKDNPHAQALAASGHLILLVTWGIQKNTVTCHEEEITWDAPEESA